MLFSRATLRIGLAVACVAVIGSTSSGCDGSSRPSSTATHTPSSTTQSSLPGAGRPQVTIGDKNFTEQFLLGALYQQALRAEGFTVALNPNIGPTEVTIQALQSGRLAMYPEYIGTWNAAIAGDTRPFPSLAAALRAGRGYATERGFELLTAGRFSDTDAIGVTRGFATENKLNTIGDLRMIAGEMTLGAPPQFQQRPTGLPALEQAYGFVPATFKALDVGSQYQALDQGTVEAADVNSTDAQLASGAYKLLADPRHVFGWGNVVPVVSAKVLAAEGPAFASTLNRVSALLSTAAMRQMNADVDLAHEDPAAVAKQFLQAHGLIAPTTTS